MSTAALIVAAGRGTRAGGEIPKQWRNIAGRSVLQHTLDAFLQHPLIDCIVLVIHKDDVALAPQQNGLILVTGGKERSDSVKAGLAALPEDVSKVLVHDVARPCVSARIIHDVIDALELHQGAAPALPVTDALWSGSDGFVTGTKDRSGLFRAQTPQGFHRHIIVEAHRAFQGLAADDVEVARAAGVRIAIVAGDENNLKITHAQDFIRAQNILERRNGY